MSVLVFLDETGEHSLPPADPTHPVFGLVLAMFDRDIYFDRCLPIAARLKTELFGHEGVVLHSHEIRRQLGAFAVLSNAELRQRCMEGLSELMGKLDYTLFASFIHKARHYETYGESARHPYHLALGFAMERLVQCLDERGETDVKILAEARGKSEDDALKEEFWKIVNSGTSTISREMCRKIQFQFTFVAKKANVFGLQVADLAAYPIGQWVLHPDKKNLPYDVVKSKFHPGDGQKHGLMVFP